MMMNSEWDDKALSQVFDAVSVGIMILDGKGRITRVNKALLAYFQISEENCHEKSFGDAFHCKLGLEKGCGYSAGCRNCELRAAVDKTLSGEEETINLEFAKSLMTDSTINDFWFKVSIAPLSIRNKKSVAITFTDITKRKEQEERLEKKKDFYFRMFDDFSTLIWRTDALGNIIYVNKEWTSFTGVSRAECLGTQYLDWIHPEDRESYVAIRNKAFEIVSPFCVEYRIRHQSGRYCWIKGIYNPSSEMDGLQGYMALGINITERKELEEGLKKAKVEAEIASQAKSEFLANMSHEIRTPLNGIVGMVDLLRLSKLTEEQKENIEIVKTCSRALLNVINDVLDFSKMEAGKLEIVEKYFDLEELVEHTIKAQVPAAHEKGLKLNVRIEETVSRYMMGDPLRLQQVLNNLLSNAIKFTEKGEIWVIVTSTPTHLISFTVEDSGLGIASSDMAKIFESFSQLDGSFTRRFGGTGLGLAISKQLVELMGGSITVNSVKNLGSRFQFMIPLKKGDPIKKPLVPPKIACPSTEYHILIVEDDIVNQQVLAKMLKECGYRVTVASNGFDAVEEIRNKDYDAVLMDIQMPEMDGLEATRRIRFINKKLPVIAVTAHALQGDRERFIASGMDDYVSKPVKIEKLIAAIERNISIKNETDSIKNMEIQVAENGQIVIAEKVEHPPQQLSIELLQPLVAAVASLSLAVDGGNLSSFEEKASCIKKLANEMDLEELKAAAFKVELEARRGNYESAAQKVLLIEDLYKKLNLNV
ncbi:response regulator [Eubacteriaceae bacterium ES2]|nr:response regulator [Eubacteriaceae bacterium ES2]